MKVRISNTIADEYMTRDVFPYLWHAGTYNLADKEVDELREDAEFYCDQFGPDIPGSLRRSYRSLLEQLNG